MDQRYDCLDIPGATRSYKERPGINPQFETYETSEQIKMHFAGFYVYETAFQEWQVVHHVVVSQTPLTHEFFCPGASACQDSPDLSIAPR